MSRLHDNACSTDFTFPLASWAQPATIDPILDLCTRYPLRLGGLRQCGTQSWPDTITHGQHWESNPRRYDFESNALFTRSHAPTIKLTMQKVLPDLRQGSSSSSNGLWHYTNGRVLI